MKIKYELDTVTDIRHMCNPEVGLYFQHINPRPGLYGHWKQKFKTYEIAFEWFKNNKTSFLPIDLMKYNNEIMISYDMVKKELNVNILWDYVDEKYIKARNIKYKKLIK